MSGNRQRDARLSAYRRDRVAAAHYLIAISDSPSERNGIHRTNYHSWRAMPTCAREWVRENASISDC